MAIIYTYPRLLNPDGTELIVVSETKNQNATRLLTLGDICNFCEGGGGGGCTDTFKYIQTTSPARAEADAGCADELIFQSSDASVTITNAGKVIDFVSVTGSGGCPTTYIIKPSCCEEVEGVMECNIYQEVSSWLYTCDETLGAMAPGYINDLEFNGVPVPNPCVEVGGCWYIEELIISATAAVDCEACCPINYQLVACDEQYLDRFTNDANSNGPTPGSVISDYDGKVILADAGDPSGELCYNVQPGDGLITTTIITTPIPGFDDCECCVQPNWKYLSCDPEPSSIIIDPLDYPGAGLSLGMPDLCLTIKENTTEDPWKCYNFSKCTEETKTGVYFEVSPSSVSPCCDDPLCATNYKYIPCDGNPVGFTTDIVVDVNPGYDSGIVVEVNAGEDTACYTLDYPTLDPLVGIAPVITDAFETPPITGCECCVTPIRKYDLCDDPGNYIYIDVVDEGFSKSTPPTCIRVEYSEETKCFELVNCDVGALEPGIISIVDNSPECCEDELCNTETTLRYEKCPTDVCGDAPASLPAALYFVDDGSMPNYIIVTDQAPGGQSWCYELNDDGQNLPETPGYGFVPKIPDEDCCPCVVFIYHDCLDPETQLYTANSGIMAAGIGIFTIVGSTTCYESEFATLALPQPDLVINDIIIENNYPDCECCASGVNPNIHEYNMCEYDTPPVGAPATIFVDLTAWHVWNPVGLHPNIISADVGIVQNVCYIWVGQVCSPPDATQIADYVGCEDCQVANPAPQMLQLDNCGGGYTEYVLASDFTPDITGLSDTDVIYVSSGALSAIDDCWTIADMYSAQPATQSGNHDWTGPMTDPGGGIEDDCDCCYQHLYQYNVCAGALGAQCADTGSNTTLTIDLGINGANTWPVVPPIIRAMENSTGTECCYTMTGPLPCAVPTGTYVSTEPSCYDGGTNPNCSII